MHEIKFTHKTDTSTMELTTEEVSLSAVLEEFKLFLLGCGYHFTGDIVIEEVDDKENVE